MTWFMPCVLAKSRGRAWTSSRLEPLPSEHPLWTMPGVLITPHIAALDAPQVKERRTQLFLGNCLRFARGEPLVNVVDKRNRF